MGDLIFQVQRLSDSAKGLAVRVGGAENVALPDNETDVSLSLIFNFFSQVAMRVIRKQSSSSSDELASL